MTARWAASGPSALSKVGMWTYPLVAYGTSSFLIRLAPPFLWSIILPYMGIWIARNAIVTRISASSFPSYGSAPK